MDPKELSINESELKSLIYKEKDKDFDAILSCHVQSMRKMNISQVKHHNFPLARIARIIKSDEDVKLLSKDYNALMGKCCQFFIEELMCCSWVHAEESRRVTLQKSDILEFIERTELLDFLWEIMRDQESF